MQLVLSLENVSGRDFCADQSYTGDFPESLLRCEGELIRPGDKRLMLAVTFTPLRSETGRAGQRHRQRPRHHPLPRGRGDEVHLHVHHQP